MRIALARSVKKAIQSLPSTTPMMALRSSVSLRASTSIGRDAGNDVPLTDEAASARHAVLELRDGEWWIEDLGSTNGTLVNGTRIERAERLRFGDELAIGRIGLRLEKGAG